MPNSNYKSRITIYEVARASGYSLATISRVINNKPNVQEETKKKVLEIIEQLGYKPSALAQGLATSKTTNIGIVLPSQNYLYISNMLYGLADIAKIYGYQTTLFLTKPERDDVKEAIEKLIASHVDGAVLFDDSLQEEDFKEILKYNIPSVFIGHNIVSENIASITLNYEDEVRKIINEHFSCGDEIVYYLNMPESGTLNEKLKNAAESEAKKINKIDKFKVIEINDVYEDTYLYFKEFFKTTKCGCFITPRDSISCAVSNAALDNGLNVPLDVQIVALIGTKYSKIMRPQLSSIYIDMYEVGSIAMRMLTKLLTGVLKQKNFVFNAVIEHRMTTRINFKRGK